jgi:NAD(P)-dependent dehydrogenase (short-subunit alcohol dehydrogenase family)
VQQISGKVAVVTGAGSGIGRAIAECLSQEGAKVAVLDIDKSAVEDVAAAIERAGGEALALSCDVSMRSEVRATADAVFRRFGAVHILCNNAGVTCFKPLTEMTDDDWDWIIGVDLMGVIYGHQAYLPRMLAQGEEGHVVNTSSGVGVLPDILPDHTGYATAKSGVVGLTASLRKELADTGIGVSVLCPQMVRTDILRSARVRQERFGGPDESMEIVPGIPDPLSDAMDPLVAGRSVIDAIKANRQFIFPHPEMRDLVVAYYESMLGDF